MEFCVTCNTELPYSQDEGKKFCVECIQAKSDAESESESESEKRKFSYGHFAYVHDDNSSPQYVPTSPTYSPPSPEYIASKRRRCGTSTEPIDVEKTAEAEVIEDEPEKENAE